MANLFEHKDRRVIPNWRSFGRTTTLGELNSIQHQEAYSIIEEGIINEYIIDWKLNRTVIHASELLSAAISNGQKDNPYVLDAANFVLNNTSVASFSQILLAKKILQKGVEIDLDESFKEITLESLPTIVNVEPIKEKIRETKRLLRIYLYNPILYVELSRYYSILGHEENSVRAMKTALHLAPNNRFVLRSATRLFAHYNNDFNDYLGYIHYYLRKSPLTSTDPWLTSAEISIATLREKSSKLVKKGIELINSKNIAPLNFTELASSIGTLELLHGSTKKSREFFNKALLSPNDNSLAQIEWASTKDKQLDINPSNFSVKMNFEALALDSYHNDEFNTALDNAAKWFMDMPFSKRPIMFGSSLASMVLKDQEKAISFLNAGLISHPNDPQLINNLAYALSLDNRPDEAIKQLEKLRNESEFDEVTDVCLLATRGLTYFRSGFDDLGRRFYLEAIERTKEINNQQLNWIAILNYAREEIRVKSEYVEHVMEAVAKIPADSKDIEIRTLRQDVIELHQKLKSSI